MRHALVPWGNLNCIKICNTTLVTRVHSTHLYQIKNSPLWKLQNSHRTKILVTPLNGSVKEKNPQRYIKSFFFFKEINPSYLNSSLPFFSAPLMDDQNTCCFWLGYYVFTNGRGKPDYEGKFIYSSTTDGHASLSSM